MVGIDPDSEGCARARELGLETRRRGRRLAARRTPTSAEHRLRGDLGQGAPRERAALRRGRHPRDRPDPGGARPVRRAGRSTWSEHLDARQRQHDHLRRPGDDPDGRTRSPRSPPVPTPRSSRRSSSALGRPGHARRTSTSSPARPRAALEEVGGAERGKAIIVLNPAEPPIMMRNTVFCAVPEPTPTSDAIAASVDAMVAEVADVRARLPAARAAVRPVRRRRPRRASFLEVEGAGDYLPAVRRQPRHHDRRRRPRSARSSPRR